MCRTATNKQYGTLWHVTKKGSPEEPPCVQVESIRVRWWWFGSLTVKAVKAFQKKYKTKYGLKVTGKVDTKTKNGISKL